MNILILKDIRTDGSENPYLTQLIQKLDIHPDIGSVQHGTIWLNFDPYKYDIIHVHWPEVLTNWRIPDRATVFNLIDKIDKWRHHSKIIATIHNTKPHSSNSKGFDTLYSELYSRVNGFIHFGNASLEWIKKQNYVANESLHTIIPHGNYEYFRKLNNIDREKARTQLGYSEDDYVILVFGQIRNIYEFRLIKQTFKKLKIKNKKLLIAGRIRISKKSLFIFEYLKTSFLDKAINMLNNFIPPQQVSTIVNAADQVFIPRIDTLNSGNIALAQTFGKPVVGPDYGVIGEELKKSGNHIYHPGNATSAAFAIESTKKSEKKIGLSNLEYANTKLGWDPIIKEHINFYKVILKKEV